MRLSQTFLLPAAVCAPLLASPLSTAQFRLGEPVEIEARLAVAAPDDEQAQAGDAEGAESATDDATAAAAGESRLLGRPQRWSSISPEGAVGEADLMAPRGDAAGESRGVLGYIWRDGVQMLSALAVVLGLLFGLRAILMRSAGGLSRAGRPSGVLEVLARYPIARGQRLILLKLARRVLLVHQSGQTMTTLCDVADPDEVASLLARIEAGASSPREASRFRSLLAQFTGDHDRISQRADHTGIADAWNRGEVVDLTKRRREPR